MSEQVKMEKQIILEVNEYQLNLMCTLFEEGKKKNVEIRNIHLQDLIDQVQPHVK